MTHRGSRAAVRSDVDRYLARIGYDGPTSVDPDTLAALQTAHMVAVPFENLHVVAGHPMSTALEWSWPKIVERRHGGWCFELNGAFGALLQRLGFDVGRHSARVWDPATGALGPDLDHLCLVVHVDGERWLVDVGFGDSALTPVRLDTDVVQPRVPRDVRIERRGHRVRYLEDVQGEWVLQYELGLDAQPLAAFQPRSDALAAGAGSGYFSAKPFATRALDAAGSRVWLLRDRLKVADGRARRLTETPVPDDEWDAALATWFSMERPPAVGPTRAPTAP